MSTGDEIGLLGTGDQGSACMFSHDPDHVDPCKKLFKNGWCIRGHLCPYSHEALQDGMQAALVAFWGEQVRFLLGFPL